MIGYCIGGRWPGVPRAVRAAAMDLSESKSARSGIAAALIGGAAAIFSFAGWNLGVGHGAGLAMLFGALAISPRRRLSPPIAATLVVILGSVVAAVPLSVVLGAGDWAQMAVMAVWMLPFAALVVIQVGPAVMWAFGIGAALHAATVWVQGVTLGIRAQGLVQNPNPAAGVLVLMATYLLTTNRRWLALPFIVALPYTGSRWGVLTMAAVLGVMVLSRTVKLRFVVAVVAAVLLITLPTWPSLTYALRLDGVDVANPDEPLWSLPGLRAQLSRVSSDAEHRLYLVDGRPAAFPIGSRDLGETTPHNVVIMIAASYGLPAAIAWAGLTGWLLLKRPRFDAAWWLLFAVAVLSLMDLYVWVGPLGWSWWLAVGLRLKGNDHAEHRLEGY